MKSDQSVDLIILCRTVEKDLEIRVQGFPLGNNTILAISLTYLKLQFKAKRGLCYFHRNICVKIIVNCLSSKRTNFR